MWFKWTIGLLILIRIFLFIYFIAVDGAYIHLDSDMYIDLAENLVTKNIFQLTSPISDFEVQSIDAPYGPQIFRTPGYPVFLAIFKLLGLKGFFWVLLCQELIYDFAIFLFYKYGSQLFNENLTQASVIFLLLDPAGIAYPKLILSETLFLPCMFGGLFAIGLYLKSLDWRYLMVAGAIMGVGALIRPIIFYIPLVAAATLITFDYKNSKRWLHAAIMIISFAATISPWIIRNYSIFDQYYFSGQTSNMFAQYHLPRVWNAASVHPYFESASIIRQMVAENRNILEQQLQRPLNAVEFFNLQQHIAFNELIKYPKTYFTQWISGTLKAMYVPFAVQVYGVYHEQGAAMPFLEMFPDTLGAEETNALGLKTSNPSLITSLINYLINVDKLYLVILVTSILNMLFAVIGTGYIIKQKDCFLWLMMLINYYYMFVAGPMGYARFRMPINGFWFLQAWMGGAWLWMICQQWHLNKGWYFLPTSKYSTNDYISQKK